MYHNATISLHGVTRYEERRAGQSGELHEGRITGAVQELHEADGFGFCDEDFYSAALEL